MVNGMKSKTCQCGGPLIEVEGLTGLFCDDCGAHYEDESDEQPVNIFSEDKLKMARGVPVNKFCIGSETKGRIEISIPIYASKIIQKKIIDEQIEMLQYLKDSIEEKGLDIMTKRVVK
jgi:hypothetical protein